MESRRLLAATILNASATFPNASETNPTKTGRGEFLITRSSGPIAQPLLVRYSVSPTSTAGSSDFQPLTGSVTIPAGRRSAAINVLPIDDSLDENNEALVLSINTGSYTIGQRTATVTIADNDPQIIPTNVGVWATFPNASETSPNTTGRGEFVFSRVTGSTAQPLVLQYYVRNTSTATSGVDFQAMTGSVTIPAGKRSAAVNLFPINDSDDEPAETVICVVKDGNYTIVHRTGTVTIADNDDPAPSDWFGDARRFRASVSVDVGAFARSDQPAEVTVNFTDLLGDAGGSGSLLINSLKVVEVSSNGSTELEDAVPFQFDQADNFNASSNASGNLVILTTGATSASTTRHYQIYFDTQGSFSAPSFTALVATTDNVSDEGQTAIEIETSTATYWLQKENGGFSSIEDSDGNDWLSFNPTPGSNAGGEFRGAPNAIFPGGGFHAGFDVGTTTIVHSGPLKTTIESTISVDKQIPGAPFDYVMRYEFYGSFVRATMVVAEDSYWFLYEGTPGGSVDGNDTVVRSDGTVTAVGTGFNDNDGIGTGSDAAASNGEEWAYFRDSSENKFIYFVHNQTDNLKDSYYLANDNGQMTVFGFGRDNDVSDPDRQKLTAQNNVFTFGLADGGGNFNASAAVIRGSFKDLNVTLGTGEAIS